MALKLCLIVAACENMGIGSKGELPWRLKKEMAYFSKMTRHVETPGMRNAVVMGRKTWNSIPTQFRPLPNRLNLVLTSTETKLDGAVVCSSLNHVLEELQSPSRKEEVEKVWVIGGNSVYHMALHSPLCHRIYLTRILKNFECDVFFENIDFSKFKKVTDPLVPEDEQEEEGIKYRYEVYERID